MSKVISLDIKNLDIKKAIMGRPKKNPADQKTKRVTRVKKLKDLYQQDATNNPAEAENRRAQLLALISLGKQRGYLTNAGKI